MLLVENNNQHLFVRHCVISHFFVTCLPQSKQLNKSKKLHTETFFVGLSTFVLQISFVSLSECVGSIYGVF